MLEIARITNCIMNFETTDGKRGIITIPNICDSNLSITNSIDGTLGIDLSLNASPSSVKELFSIEMEDNKESEDKMDKMKMRYTVVSCIFPSNSGEYHSDSKVYNYIVNGPPCNCNIDKNMLFQVYDDAGVLKHNGAKLLCVNKLGFYCYEDIYDVFDQTLYTIDRYTVSKDTIDVDSLEPAKLLNDTTKSQKAKSLVCDAAPILTSSIKETNKVSDDFGVTMDKAVEELLKNDSSFKKEYTCNFNSTDNTEEEKSMFDKMMKNIEFGKVNTSDLAYTFNGICFRDADGNYTSLNPDGTFTNVYDMVMDIPIYVMPVGKDQIKVGDIIKYFDKWVMIAQIDNTTITTIDPWTREIRVIIPEKSVFGFDYYTKVIDIFSGININADSSNPFGIILPFMMMSDKSDIDPMMLMMMMNGQNLNGMNPMMMYMMMSKDSGIKKDNMLPLMMMMNNGMFGGNSCNCGNSFKCDCTANATESAPYSFYYDTGAAEKSGDDSQNSKED